MEAPWERMPLYVKAGSIIPFGPQIEYAGQKPDAPITLWVYTGADASFTLNENEGTNYSHEKGAFSIDRLRSILFTKKCILAEKLSR